MSYQHYVRTPPADHNYNLRDRLHNRQLPGRMSHLTNCNFIVRMCFVVVLTVLTLLTLFTVLYFICITVQLRYDNCFIKETFDLIFTPAV